LAAFAAKYDWAGNFVPPELRYSFLSSTPVLPIALDMGILVTIRR
jgi:hypothetical protein